MAKFGNIKKTTKGRNKKTGKWETSERSYSYDNSKMSGRQQLKAIKMANVTQRGKTARALSRHSAITMSTQAMADAHATAATGKNQSIGVLDKISDLVNPTKDKENDTGETGSGSDGSDGSSIRGGI